MRTHYQLNYASARPQMYDKLSREQKARRIIKILENFFRKSKFKDLAVLDIGASSGIIDNILADRFKKVVGVDIDNEAVEFARKTFKKKRLEFRIGDAMNLDFPAGTFDVVVCAHTYEHVPDQTKLFSEIHRVLKHGGVCYLAAQNRLFPWEPHYSLPFLSWLPKKVANLYVKLTRRVPIYYETPRTYWGLKNLAGKFKIHDYTAKILQDPKKYSYDDSIKPPVSYLLPLLSPMAVFLSPTFFWILKKDK